MPLITPLAPIISSVTANSFTVTRNPEGNPGTTFYSYMVIFNATTNYLNGSGSFVTTNTWEELSTLTVTSAIPNTLYALSLAAALDSTGTSATIYGPSASVVTLAALPIANAYSSIFSTTVTTNWMANNNPTGTQFYVQLSTDPGFLSGVINSGWVTTTGFQFTGLLPGTIYYAQVKARNSALEETTYVSLGSTTTQVGPARVHLINVDNLLVERGFLITWSPNLETNVVSYNIYRSPSPTDDSSFLKLATVPFSITSYVDNVPYSFGIVWYYKVTALDDGGNESSLDLTTAVQDNSYHSFEEQPFKGIAVNTVDIVNDEIPSGLINTSNTLYTTAFPYRPLTLEVYLNGVKMARGVDFTEGPLSQQFTMINPPDTGALLRIYYIKF